MSSYLVLIRGLPGSGKSTLAKSMTGYRHFEADQFFVVDGVYRYDPALAGAAHQQCQEKTHKALLCGDNVVVSNTFTRLWEMEPYFRMVACLDVTVRVVEALGEYPNVHGVPSEVIDKMRARWEPTPLEYLTN